MICYAITWCLTNGMFQFTRMKLKAVITKQRRHPCSCIPCVFIKSCYSFSVILSYCQTKKRIPSHFLMGVVKTIFITAYMSVVAHPACICIRQLPTTMLKKLYLNIPGPRKNTYKSKIYLVFMAHFSCATLRPTKNTKLCLTWADQRVWRSAFAVHTRLIENTDSESYSMRTVDKCVCSNSTAGVSSYCLVHSPPVGGTRVILWIHFKYSLYCEGH